MSLDEFARENGIAFCKRCGAPIPAYAGHEIAVGHSDYHRLLDAVSNDKPIPADLLAKAKRTAEAYEPMGIPDETARAINAPALPEGTSMLDLEEMARTHNDCLEVCGECGLSSELGQALLWAIDRIRQLEDEKFQLFTFIGGQVANDRLQPNPLHPEDCRWCKPKP